MASHGIKDQVAIIGMGCTQFREHWDKGVDDLLIDSATAAFDSAGVSKDDVDAFWLGTASSGMSGLTLSQPLKLEGKPVTRVENFCATGSEALRQASYAVASGAYDMAMAIGVEKIKDSGYQGLNAAPAPHDGTKRNLTAAAMYSLVLPAYAARYGVDEDELRMVVAKIAEKNHRNGALNPLAQFRREMPAEKICEMASVAGRLSVFDCSGVADGSAAAIVVRAEDAHKYCDDPLYIKALSFVSGTGGGLIDPDYDYTTFPECEMAGADAYRQAGIDDPRSALAMAEVHDCFTPTEMVLMEDLSFCERGTAWKEVLAGTFERTGDMPVNTDGGLKAFGHPVGASGLRMHYECWLQLRNKAGDDRQIDLSTRNLGLIHNLGGYPGEMVSFVSILGPELG
ncbi:acetyl-CoA acetyltransferase [Candidatus Poriferisocius sp.]|uniref:acetyl-CoA acetyltransferase n=1 Tax=Candidatus Poriferisocius sp. TaxID=3101276 RepID=UPI003B01E9DE